MAILVVAIHTHPFDEIAGSLLLRIWNIITSLAVPYFFMASGFFLFQKLREHDKAAQLDIIKKYGTRITNLYIYWTIIFLPITIWGFATDNIPIVKDSLLFIRGVFLIGENYYSWPLWYLLSIIYSLILIYILVYKNKNINAIFVVSLFVFFISVLINFIVYNESSNRIDILAKAISVVFLNGRLFSGMLYIMIGALFAYGKIQFPKNTWIPLLLLGLLFQWTSVPFISSFTFVLLPTMLFYGSLNMKLDKLEHGYFFRKSSTIIYFLHMIVLFLYTLIFKEFPYFGFDAFLISALIPILLTPIILRYENKYALLKKIF